LKRNRRYRATPVKNIKPERLAGLGPKVLVGIDVAKSEQFVAFGSTALDGEIVIGKWKHPAETREFFAMCEALRAGGQEVTIVMEPTGTYGDPLIEWFQSNDFEVRRILGKQVHDGAAAIDGVVSGHDAKAACLLLTLYLLRGSQKWLPQPEENRVARALVAQYAWHAAQCGRLRGMAEGLLARHWPELGEFLRPRAKVYWRLLEAFGGPGRVAAEPTEAAEFMRRVGRNFLCESKVQRIVESARGTLGVPMVVAEEAWLQHIASEYRRSAKLREKSHQEMETLVRAYVDERLLTLLGSGAVATLLAYNLNPRAFPSANAFLKALGLSLKEHSSGQHNGRQRITKRGAPRARWMMVLAALRLIAADPVVKAWHTKKRERDGQKSGGRNGLISAIAITRKLAKAAWHVAQGNDFDASKLYDTSRLQIDDTDGPADAQPPADERTLPVDPLDDIECGATARACT